jgi:hypothetical protein
VLRTLNDSVRALLFHAAVPASFWPEALATATCTLNRRPCLPRNNDTPYKLLYGQHPSYDHLRIFGCLCYLNLTATTANKLSPRSVVCIFLGHPADTKGYRCYDPETNRIIVSRHFYFDETVFPFRSRSAPAPTPAPSSPDELLPLQPVCRVVPRLAPLPPRAPMGCSPPPPSSPPHDAASLPAAACATPTPPDHAAMSPSHDTAPTSSPPVHDASSTTPPSTPATGSPSSIPNDDTVAPSPSSTRVRATTSPPLTFDKVAPLPLSTHPHAVQTPPAPAPQHRMVTRARAGVFKPNPRYATVATVVEPPPVSSSIRAALQYADWRQALRDEHDVILRNKTWRLVPRPPSVRVIIGYSTLNFGVLYFPR